jgi:GntR family transcriptional regulator/MocR family aminotransferase
MPKETEEIPFVSIQLDDSSSVPIYKQLYNAIRESILLGRLKREQKLPSTRTLAKELKVSRNTVILAFEQLIAEGYVKGIAGAGTYVADDIPDKLLKIKKKPEHFEDGLINTPRSDKRLNPPSSSQLYMPENNIIPFQHGIPSVEDFPFDKWLKIFNKIVRGFTINQLSKIDRTGYKALKEAIAKYLQTYRAVNCTPEQIFIVNGSQQGLYLISRVLLKEKDKVLLEDPFYFGVRDAICSAKVNIIPVPVDEEGLRVDYAIKNFPEANLIYTTPSHQYPLGSTLSISRRLKLLEFAGKNNIWIIEDDYDGEFRYAGNPLPSLQGMDKWGQVIYIGTFSKVLFPGLRLGYLVLPSLDLVNSFTAEKSIIDRQSPILEQLVTAKFMEEGYFTTHIRKMRMLYKERQEFLINEINKEIGNLITIRPSASGMHVIAWLPEYLDDKEVSKILRNNKLVVYPLSKCILKYKRKPALILGYTAFNKDEIKRGINILRDIIKSLCR